MPPIIICPPYIWTPPYVQRILIWYLFSYIIKCFPTLEVDMGGSSGLGCVQMPPMFIYPCMFGCCLYVWMPPICLDTPDIQTYGGIQTLGGVQTYGGIQTYRGCTNVWGIWIPPKSDKACFLCVICSTGASN